MTLQISGTAEKLGAKQLVFDHFIKQEGVVKTLGSVHVFMMLATGEFYLNWWRFPTREEKAKDKSIKSTTPYMVKLSEKFGVLPGAYVSSHITQDKVTHSWEAVQLTVTTTRVVFLERETRIAYVAPLNALVHGMHDEPDYDPWKRVRVKTSA